MSVGHRHHRAEYGAIDKAHERDLRTLLAQPWFQQAVAAYRNEDDDHDVPYGGGSLTDRRTVAWDRHLAQAINAGQFKVGGKAIDPRSTGRVHEAVEGAIINSWERVRQLLGWPETHSRYNRAHDVADVAEHHAVDEMGWHWPEYQKAWEPFLKVEEHEQITNPPPNLLLDPYQGTKLYTKMATHRMARQQRVVAPFAAQVGGRLAKDGHHYIADPNRPGKYLMVT